MPRVVHFELPADDPERAINFYRDVFGWEIQKWQGPVDYWLVMTGPKEQPGIDGAIMRREGQSGPINTIDVSSIDDFVKKVEGAGGKVVAPKEHIPGVGHFAYCSDPEGNVFGIMQFEAGAMA